MSVPSNTIPSFFFLAATPFCLFSPCIYRAALFVSVWCEVGQEVCPLPPVITKHTYCSLVGKTNKKPPKPTKQTKKPNNNQPRQTNKTTRSSREVFIIWFGVELESAAATTSSTCGSVAKHKYGEMQLRHKTWNTLETALILAFSNLTSFYITVV